jgi:hypothetical protein
MPSDAVYPQCFDAPAPTPGAAEYLGAPSVRLLVEFFQSKGLAALKQEDRQEDWYQDWVDYQAKHGLYASVLSPGRYSSRGHRFSVVKLARFVEALAYFSPAHAYSLHVSFLGLFPILMSSNEASSPSASPRRPTGRTCSPTSSRCARRARAAGSPTGRSITSGTRMRQT